LLELPITIFVGGGTLWVLVFATVAGAVEIALEREKGILALGVVWRALEWDSIVKLGNPPLLWEDKVISVTTSPCQWST
jgi:hypothetical protein